jgi:hypothetical protein
VHTSTAAYLGAGDVQGLSAAAGVGSALSVGMLVMSPTTCCWQAPPSLSQHAALQRFSCPVGGVVHVRHVCNSSIQVINGVCGARVTGPVGWTTLAAAVIAQSGPQRVHQVTVTMFYAHNAPSLPPALVSTVRCPHKDADRYCSSPQTNANVNLLHAGSATPLVVQSSRPCML